ncbi:ABC transporter permease [Candidatus Hepatincolaceae symbiont of Richtersius coronifer]
MQLNKKNRLLHNLLLVNLASGIGKTSIQFLENAGLKAIFILNALINLFLPPLYFKVFYRQFVEIAFYSLPLVGLTSAFTGMVLALQSYMGFAMLSSEGAISNIVVVSITRELGPMLTALMVAGRISGSMAAEIGTMRVSEQIDALSTMSVNPIKYLITPRIIAGILALPLLTLLSDIIGIMGGYFIAIFQLEFNSTLYIQKTWNFLTAWDVISGLIKGALFGLLITSMGCFFGYFSTKGAKGVGKSTTNAVVTACILIFVFDYILTAIFFNT